MNEKVHLPKVTVALITYNRTKYLKEAIEGILNQTFRNFELIIMDNGSSPETYKFIKPYLNDQVKYHRNEINNRSYLNYPFVLALGEYLIITHDDDIMKDTLLETQVAILDQNLDVIIVGANTTFIDGNSKLIQLKGQKIKSDIVWHKNEFIRDSITKGIYMPCPTVMFRKELFNNFNLRFDLNVGPATDLYLWFQTNLLDYKIYLISEPLYYYRIHTSQDSTVSRIEMDFKIYSPIIELLRNNGLFELLPQAMRQRHNIMFDSIVNSYFHKSINLGEMRNLLLKLRLLGFKPTIQSTRSIVKLVIRFLNF
jgi:glycosyltransferase involved in cell wall biosynthesis